MKLTKRQIDFIINSDVEMIASYIIEDEGLSIIEAFDKIYNSPIYSKLTDTKTGLYIQSPAYIYALMNGN